MKDLLDLIEDCKANKEVDAEDLRYAVIALTTVINMSSNKLMRFYKQDMKPIDKILLENHFAAWTNALNKSPKDWLGWNNDPKNPEYQRFHAIGTKLADKAMKGELPNQKKEKGADNV